MPRSTHVCMVCWACRLNNNNNNNNCGSQPPVSQPPLTIARPAPCVVPPLPSPKAPGRYGCFPLLQRPRSCASRFSRHVREALCMDGGHPPRRQSTGNTCTERVWDGRPPIALCYARVAADRLTGFALALLLVRHRCVWRLHTLACCVLHIHTLSRIGAVAMLDAAGALLEHIQQTMVWLSGTPAGVCLLLRVCVFWGWWGQQQQRRYMPSTVGPLL